jgi:thiol-disulfide isomerase/thioredoxin
MMNKVLLSLSVLAFAWVSCKQTKGTPSITGAIKGGEGVYIYLEKLTPEKAIILDSAKIDAKGSFSIYSKPQNRTFYQLRIGNQKPQSNVAPGSNVMVFISDSTETLTFEANAENASASYKVSGSEETFILQQINVYAMRYQSMMDSLNNAYQKNPQQFNQAEANALMTKTAEQNATELKKIIENNSGRLVTLQAISMMNPESDPTLFINASNALNTKHPNNPFVVNFASTVSELTKLLPGTVAPDFEINTPEGKPISLSSFKGKYVLIDFWASWCRPCRMTNPELVKLYNKHKKNNFEIFGVSLDQNKDAWEEAIQQDKLMWPQGSDLLFWEAAPAKIYKVTFIPYNILIDPDGKIVAKNLTGEALDKKLQELLTAKAGA